MKVLLAPTEDFIKRGRSQLTAQASAGSSVVISVANGNDFVVNEYVVIGIEGGETAELCKITAVAATTVTVATLVMTHLVDEPIVGYRYNQRKFYGGLTATGAFAEITGSGSPITIAVNDPQGTLCEYIGGEGYLYFKSTYWNSTTSEESNIADANTVLADESVRYCSIYAIKKQAGLTNNPYITDGLIEGYRKRAESEVDSYLNSKYVLPLINSLSQPEIPWMVENITVLLAAGYLDWQQLGMEGQGVKWLGQARGILKALQTPGGQQLLGANKQEMQSVPASTSVRGFPNTVDNDNGPARFFTTGQTF